MKLEILIRINQFSQGALSLIELNEWFVSLGLSDRKDVVNILAEVSIQSRATDDDLISAVQELRLKQGSGILSLAQKGIGMSFYRSIINVSDRGWEDVFKLLLLLFSNADKRRRETLCNRGCSHWWHSDLSDSEVVEKLLTRLHTH